MEEEKLRRTLDYACTAVAEGQIAVAAGLLKLFRVNVALTQRSGQAIPSLVWERYDEICRSHRSVNG